MHGVREQKILRTRRYVELWSERYPEYRPCMIFQQSADRPAQDGRFVYSDACQGLHILY